MSLVFFGWWKKGLTTALFLALAVPCGAICAAKGFAADGATWSRTERSPFVKIVNETCKSVVSIQGEKQCESPRGANRLGGQYDVYNGMGAGVIIDERGYILTNYHVVKGLLKLEVVTNDGERYREVEIVRNDIATDLAILKIKPKEPLKKIRMGRVDRIELAEDVYAIGNPYGYKCSISRGVVSALDRPLEVSDTLAYERVIQTDAAINPGNSGGPLINIDGEMIGLNAAVREEAENIAFAIPIDVVADVAERLMRQSVAKMTHHGLKFRVVDADEPDYPEGANGEDCLVVDAVDAKSPAARAGVEPGDVLVASNEFPIHSTLDFTCSLVDLGLADVAELKLERAGRSFETALAFSDLAAPRRNEFYAQAAKRNRESASESRRANDYVEAKVASAAADELVLENVESVAESSPAADADGEETAAQVVWDELGVEVEETSATEYRRLYPQLQAISIGEFNFEPRAGVTVVRASASGLLSSGDAPLQKGDLIFGFGVGKSKDGQLSVATLDNLYYIAEKRDELARVDGGKARVYLIRGGKPYFLDIRLD
ncbi:MAG: serine protease [Thermoguttaceae bacterium]|nr:serine protease [Thermoguttaceae bacterium]